MREKVSLLLSFEAIDGAGKTSVAERLLSELRAAGYEVVYTREPGGTPFAETLRALLLHGEDIDPVTELLCMFAARRQNITEVILPALNAGKIVLCDRFTDSSFAYQGGGRGLAKETLVQLERIVQTMPDAFIEPDLTFWFDLPVEIAAKRRAGVHQSDRFEKQEQAFFQRVSNAYRDRFEASNGRMKRVDANMSPDGVWAQVLDHLSGAGIRIA